MTVPLVFAGVSRRFAVLFPFRFLPVPMSLVEDSGSDLDSSDPESNACFGAQLVSDPEPDPPPSLHIQHVTLLTLGSQRILDEFEGLNKEILTKKKRRGKPIVDASDVHLGV